VLGDYLAFKSRCVPLLLLLLLLLPPLHRCA
jgi:hypothetical protein